MGDTGSLTIGGIIAVWQLLSKRNADPLLWIFLVENLSVVLQVSYFKYTKKRFEGRRIFLMSPLHHHYQKKGYHESKIVTVLDCCDYAGHFINCYFKIKIT
jgi:phospho-N-acetylmuramoyl-pentapeptide-transferase